jgi:hypothetical protein
MKPKKDLWPVTVNQARAALVLRGSSLHKWATARGYSSSYLYASLRGIRDGDKSRKIVSELLADIHS